MESAFPEVHLRGVEMNVRGDAGLVLDFIELGLPRELKNHPANPRSFWWQGEDNLVVRVLGLAVGNARTWSSAMTSDENAPGVASARRIANMHGGPLLRDIDRVPLLENSDLAISDLAADRQGLLQT